MTTTHPATDVQTYRHVLWYDYHRSGVVIRYHFSVENIYNSLDSYYGDYINNNSDRFDN
jgi:hypothetical protein